MRKYAYILLLTIMCLVGDILPVYAVSKLNPENKHMIGVTGGLGYYGLLNNMEGSKVPMGVSPSIGFAYRYYHNGFILQTGLDGYYNWSTTVFPKIVETQRMLDADWNNEPFRMTATLTDRKDVYQTMSINIPFYLGYEKEKFYFLAGASVGIHVTGSAYTSAHLSTAADYERFIGLFELMPNHGLLEQDVESKKMSLSLNPNIMLHAEIGGRVDNFNNSTGFRRRVHNYRIYVAGFVDYGVLNSHKNENVGDQLHLEFDNGVHATMVPMMLSSQMLNAAVHPLMVGIKVTALFNMPQPGKSFIYDYHTTENHYRKRGGNQSMK